MDPGFAVLVGLVAIGVVLALAWRSMSAAAHGGDGGGIHGGGDGGGGGGGGDSGGS